MEKVFASFILVFTREIEMAIWKKVAKEISVGLREAKTNDKFELSMADDIDTILIWKSNQDNSSQKYHLRIYWVSWEKAILIIRKINDQPDEIIFNTTKELVYFVCQNYQLKPGKIMWIEHFAANKMFALDTYFQASIFNTEVVQHKVEQSKLETLIGKVL